VIAAGAGLGHYTTEGGYLFPNAKVVRIDTQPKGPWQGLRTADLHVRADASRRRGDHRAGIALLRVHRHQIAEKDVEVRQGRRGLALLCRLWRPMSDGTGDSFTILTTAPRPDIAPIHGST
jgi:hypothetical protein